jgi:D-amino-acid dehydrogenase
MDCAASLESDQDYWSSPIEAAARGEHVTVIGAGIVGLTSAAALVRAGRQVTVIDAADEAARGASRGNGCQLSYGYVTPLAQPGLPAELPKLLLARGGPLRIALKADPAQWRWMWHFIAACGASSAWRSTLALLDLGRLSRRETERWLRCAGRQDLGFSRSGKIVLYATPSAFDAACRQRALQAPYGPEQRPLPGDGFLAVEPALASFRGTVAGAVHTPSECAIDSLALCRELERELKQRGVGFEYGVQVRAFAREGQRVTRLVTNADTRPVEAVVVANGTGSAPLAARLGLRLPVYPLKGYSITLPVRDPAAAPVASVTDAARKIVYARIGGHLRVAGMAEIAGYDSGIDPKRIAQLVAATRKAFGAAVDTNSVDPWSGLRPATPSSVPIIARSPLDNLYFNVGHGALGLTLAFGSAHRLAQLVIGGKAGTNTPGHPQ